MQKTLCLCLLLLVLVIFGGCTTVRDRRRHERLNVAETANLQAELVKLQTRVEEMDAVQQRIFGELESLRRDVGHRDKETAERLDKLDQGLRALDAARQEDKKAIVKLFKAATTTPPPVHERGYEHTVKTGETLSEIARAYKVTVDAIVRANKLKNANSIRVGQKLFIPE